MEVQCTKCKKYGRGRVAFPDMKTGEMNWLCKECGIAFFEHMMKQRRN